MPPTNLGGIRCTTYMTEQEWDDQWPREWSGPSEGRHRNARLVESSCLNGKKPIDLAKLNYQNPVVRHRDCGADECLGELICAVVVVC